MLRELRYHMRLTWRWSPGIILLGEERRTGPVPSHIDLFDADIIGGLERYHKQHAAGIANRNLLVARNCDLYRAERCEYRPARSTDRQSIGGECSKIDHPRRSATYRKYQSISSSATNVITGLAWYSITH